MRTRWKTPVSLTLLVVFTFNTCLFGVLLTASLYLHKAQEKDALQKPSKEIIELRIDEMLVEHRNTEFQWEKDWEFMFHGEMYDVVESRKEGSTWIFACKHDTKEEILKNRAAREAKRNQQDRETQAKKNLKVGSDFLTHHSDQVNSTIASDFTPSLKEHHRSTVHRSVPHPPPWFS